LRWSRLSEIASQYSEALPKGEFVIVVAGDNKGTEHTSQRDVAEIVRNLVESGLKPSEVAREAAAMTGLPKSELYELALKMKKTET
jgi:16S rRNA (cytidine1402-2'-O)-methyltransferase